MIPRMTLDISWSDLCSGLIGCVASSTPEYERVEEGWAPGQGFAHLSVRSTFDAYLPIYPPLGVSGYRALNAVIKDFYENPEEERGHV